MTRPPAARPVAAPVPRIEILCKRPDFLAAAGARRQSRPAFTLQARERRDPRSEAGAGPGSKAGVNLAGADAVRVGFTCSKKVGNAVARNRAKRRLRAAAREVLPRLGRPGWDYVLIGRPDETASRPFALLLAELEDALAAIHAPPRVRRE